MNELKPTDTQQRSKQLRDLGTDRKECTEEASWDQRDRIRPTNGLEVARRVSLCWAITCHCISPIYPNPFPNIKY